MVHTRVALKNRRVTIRTQHPVPMLNWCAKQFGNSENNWVYHRTSDECYTFLFNKEEDATLFALQWVGNENS